MFKSLYVVVKIITLGNYQQGVVLPGNILLSKLSFLSN